MAKHAEAQENTGDLAFQSAIGESGEGPQAAGQGEKAKKDPNGGLFLRILFPICAFIVVVTIIASAALRDARLLPGGVYEARSRQLQAEPEAQEEQEAQPSAAPAEAREAQQQAEQQPAEQAAEQTFPAQAYQKTALYVDDKCIGTLASVQAAADLLEEIKAHYIAMLRQDGVEGEIKAEFQNEVSLQAAQPDAETISAEALLKTLVGEKTPLKVVCTVTREQRETIAYKTQTQSDKYLLAGTRIIESMGMPGERVTLSTSVYVNGKRKSTDIKAEVLAQPQDALIREGTQEVTGAREPGKREGKKGPETSLTFISPIKGRVVLNFGQSRGVLHLGLDYVPEDETAPEVAASAAGEVVCVMERGGYGLMVEIDHGEGFVTRYAHLKKANVTLGQRVAQGECIGEAGQSGNADGVQLHFELRIHGEAYNPRFYLEN